MKYDIIYNVGWGFGIFFILVFIAFAVSGLCALVRLIYERTKK